MKIKLAFLLLFCLALVDAATLRESVIESQLNELMQKIKDKNVVMLTNPTSVDGKMRPLFDRILAQR
jgi:outer membrane lipoprotein-sorting protein